LNEFLKGVKTERCPIVLTQEQCETLAALDRFNELEEHSSYDTLKGTYVAPKKEEETSVKPEPKKEAVKPSGVIVPKKQKGTSKAATTNNMSSPTKALEKKDSKITGSTE
jgi:hypothetical protein